MSIKAKESHPVSGKNTQSMEIETLDQHLKDKSLDQKIFHQNPIYCIDEDIKEEEKKQGENLKNSRSDDKNESKMRSGGPIQPHPFLLKFLKDDDLVRLSIRPRWDPLLELSSEISEIPQQELKDLLEATTKCFASDFEMDDSICFKHLREEEDETRKTETSHMTSYFINFIKITIRNCRFLNAKYQNFFCGFVIGGLPVETHGDEPPPIDKKVLIIAVQNLKKKQIFPGIAVLPTSYKEFSSNTYNGHLELLKDTLEIIGKRWSPYEEFFGIITNFKETIFMRYDRSKKIYYSWHYIVNFNECFLQRKSPANVEVFIKIWVAMIFKTAQTYYKHLNEKPEFA